MIVIDAGVIALLCVIVVTIAAYKYSTHATRRKVIDQLTAENKTLREGIEILRDEAESWTGDPYSDLVLRRIRETSQALRAKGRQGL